VVRRRRDAVSAGSFAAVDCWSCLPAAAACTTSTHPRSRLMLVMMMLVMLVMLVMLLVLLLMMLVMLLMMLPATSSCSLCSRIHTRL